jgi:hypothetical protein
LGKCLVREDCKELKMYKKGKDIRKKRHLAAFVFFSSVFGEKFPTAEFGMISAETCCWEIKRK